MAIHYLQLKPEGDLPDISTLKPFLAVLVIEEPQSATWRVKASQWLVKSGCIYMMAWGSDCSDWEDAVDLANIEQFSYGEIPEDELVMTSEHEDAKLKDVFWQAKNSARHACVEFANTVVVHISDENKEAELLGLYDSV